MVTGGSMVTLLLAVVAARAADPVPAAPPAVPAVGMHGPAGVACAHCHDDVHAGAGTGGCQRCHGTDAWSPALFTVAEHAETRFPLVGRHQDVACASCHTREVVASASASAAAPVVRLAGLPTNCAGCHFDRHRGKLGAECETCHAPTGFTPVLVDFDHLARTGFALTTPHADIACDACHDGDNGRAMRLVASATCETCHTPGHGAFDRVGPCESCHRVDQASALGMPWGGPTPLGVSWGGPTLASFAAATFDHRRGTAFPLERRHAAEACAACHPVGSAAPDDRCSACHVDVHSGQLGTGCEDCHRPDRWRIVRFDHDSTLFTLRGRHFVTPCLSCHANQRWIGLADQCWDCHVADLARAPASIPAHTVGLPDCSDCHGTWTW